MQPYSSFFGTDRRELGVFPWPTTKKTTFKLHFYGCLKVVFKLNSLKEKFSFYVNSLALYTFQ